MVWNTHSWRYKGMRDNSLVITIWSRTESAFTTLKSLQAKCCFLQLRDKTFEYCICAALTDYLVEKRLLFVLFFSNMIPFSLLHNAAASCGLLSKRGGNIPATASHSVSWRRRGSRLTALSVLLWVSLTHRKVFLLTEQVDQHERCSRNLCK